MGQPVDAIREPGVAEALRFHLRVPGSPHCPALYACSRCHALVLGVDIDAHEQWHLDRAA